MLMIKIAIRFPDNMVGVFDAEGEQIPQYLGQYEDVKGSILRDAPLDTVFAYWFNYDTKPETLPREEW